MNIRKENEIRKLNCIDQIKSDRSKRTPGEEFGIYNCTYLHTEQRNLDAVEMVTDCGSTFVPLNV